MKQRAVQPSFCSAGLLIPARAMLLSVTITPPRSAACAECTASAVMRRFAA